MSLTLELFDTSEIPIVLAECKRVPQSGGRIAVVGILEEEGSGVVLQLCEGDSQALPQLRGLPRHIFIARALEEAGFRVQKQVHSVSEGGADLFKVLSQGSKGGTMIRQDFLNLFRLQPGKKVRLKDHDTGWAQTKEVARQQEKSRVKPPS
jgi:hypothetical protein